MTDKARYTIVGADSMARMKLTHENTAGDPTGTRLLEILIALRTKKGVVYTTHCEVDDYEFVLTTTSKEIHLAIGSMPEEGRILFCRAINKDLQDLDRTGLIFLPPMGDEHETQRAMHVMRSRAEGDDQIFLTISRAG